MGLIFKHRLVSIMGMLLFAFTANLYKSVPFIYFFALLHFVFLVVLVIKNDFKVSVKKIAIGKSTSLMLLAPYLIATLVGAIASYGDALIAERIVSFMLPLVCVDTVVAGILTLSFSQKSTYQAQFETTGSSDSSSINQANGSPMVGNNDTAGGRHGCGTPSWSPDDSRSQRYGDYSSGLDMGATNPATGLHMANGAVDVGGNLYGMNHDTWSSITGGSDSRFDSGISSYTPDYSHDYNSDINRHN